MKTLDLWPTNIFVFEDFLSEEYFCQISKLNLQNQQHVELFELNNKIIESITEIFNKPISEKNLSVEITEIWNNTKKQNDPHRPHCHANNDYSGIYYVTRGCSTHFLDPRPQALTFDLGYNQSVAKIRATPNKCIFFPSWLIHWVDDDFFDDSSKQRQTIAFNIKFRGQIGKKGSFTEVLA